MRYISNPRRAPRVPARLRVEVLHRGLDFQAETEDVGPKGCLVVSPRPLDPGAWVRLMLEADPLPEKLRVTGRVAWAIQPARARAGVAFAEMQVERNRDPFAWFERLMRASPGLVPLLRYVPDRLPFDTPLYLLPPPRFIVDFSEAELGLIAGMRNGATVEHLLRRMEPERKNEGRLIFARETVALLKLAQDLGFDDAAAFLDFHLSRMANGRPLSLIYGAKPPAQGGIESGRADERLIPAQNGDACDDPSATLEFSRRS